MAGRVQEGIATRSRILAAAEKLFAAQGVDGVSIRDIAAEAKVNSASTHYHFGAKADLVEAVLHARVEQVRARRHEILEQIADSSHPVEYQIAEALVRPTAEIGDDYAAFIVVLSDHPDFLAMATEAFEDQSEELLRLLQRARPDLPPEIAAYRFATAQVIANQLLGRRRRRIEMWLERLEPGATVDYVEALIETLAASLAAPAPAPPVSSRKARTAPKPKASAKPKTAAKRARKND